jgi:hypothetical protein
VTPAQLYVGSIEEFITVRGTGFTGALSTMVEFSGPAGTRIVEPSVIASDGSELTSWLPIEFGLAVGRVSVTVLAIDSESTRRIGPAFFDVVDFPSQRPPLLNVPEVVLAEAAGPAGSNVTFNVMGLSFVDPAPVISCNRNSGSLFPVGTTTVICTATDSFASTSANFLVVVADTERPALVVPASFITTDPVVTFVVTATDAVDGPITPDCLPSSGWTFAEGTTTVLCTATDNSANTALATFEVTLVVAPLLVLPDDFVVEATGPDGAIAGYVASAIGGSVTCTPPSGSLFPLGVTEVQCSATGPGGTSHGSFRITVVDTTPPTIIEITPSKTLLWPPNHSMVPISFAVLATDLVSTNLISHIESITSNQPENGTGDGDTSPDWRILGPLTSELRAERAGNSDRIYTITIVTVDGSGNRASAVTTVRVAASRRRAI